jgi:hypothetical protein
MSSRDFISRNKNVDLVTSATKTRDSKSKIVCDTEELKELITKWARNAGWEFEKFADFLELIGVKTPVKLGEYDGENNSFKCITALNTGISISLLYGIAYCSEIRVTEGEETRHYIANVNTEPGKSVPKVTFDTRNIKRNGKELDCFYSEYFWRRTLKLDETHVLNIIIDGLDKHDEKSENFVLRNCTEIEKY